ncbi:MAG TPA: hypothetical protein HA306_01035, partial [Methanosarcina sp.]|nr:hypothetical protein [Methanosarcina sp.]
MPGLTQRQISNFYEMTSEQPYSVSQLAKYLKEKYNLKEPLKRIYKKIYDFFKTQLGKLHFVTGREDSILWVRANPLNPLTLIQDKQVSDKTELDSGRHCDQPEKTYKHSIQDKQVSDKTELDSGRHCDQPEKTYKHS